MITYDGVNYCALEACPERLFRDAYGNCQMCSGPISPKSHSFECSACDDTDHPRKMDGDNCVPDGW